MRCLLDKVTARYTLQGLLKLAENRELTREELFSLDLVAIYDQPMIMNWSNEKQRIQKRLSSMSDQLPMPYCRVSLPEVLQPERFFP